MVSVDFITLHNVQYLTFAGSEALLIRRHSLRRASGLNLTTRQSTQQTTQSLTIWLYNSAGRNLFFWGISVKLLTSPQNKEESDFSGPAPALRRFFALILRLSNSRRNDAAAKPAKKEAVMTALLELIVLLRWMHWWESVVLQYGRNNTHHLSTIGHSSLEVSYLPTVDLPTLRYHFFVSYS